MCELTQLGHTELRAGCRDCPCDGGSREGPRCARAARDWNRNHRSSDRSACRRDDANHHDADHDAPEFCRHHRADSLTVAELRRHNEPGMSERALGLEGELHHGSPDAMNRPSLRPVHLLTNPRITFFAFTTRRETQT